MTARTEALTAGCSGHAACAAAVTPLHSQQQLSQTVISLNSPTSDSFQAKQLFSAESSGPDPPIPQLPYKNDTFEA